MLSLLGLAPSSRARFGAIVQQDQGPDKLHADPPATPRPQNAAV
jgi:hypothetical protein